MRTVARRAAAVVATTVAVLVSGAAPATAAADHFTFVEDWTGTTAFSAGEGPCVGYAGTLFEDRHMVARGVEPSNGEEELVIVASVDADFSVTPHDASDGPTYIGTYREMSGGRFVVTEEGDEPVVAHFAVHATAEGSDGSVLKFVLSGRITVRPDGTVATFDEGIHCIR